MAAHKWNFYDFAQIFITHLFFNENMLRGLGLYSGDSKPDEMTSCGPRGVKCCLRNLLHDESVRSLVIIRLVTEMVEVVNGET